MSSFRYASRCSPKNMQSLKKTARPKRNVPQYMLCTHVIFPTILMLFWLHSFSILDKFLVTSQLWTWRALNKMSGLFRGTWHDIALHYTTLHCLTLPCLAFPCLTLPYLALPCLTLPYLALPCLTLPYLAVPCPAVPCCTALHYTTLYFPAINPMKPMPQCRCPKTDLIQTRPDDSIWALGKAAVRRVPCSVSIIFALGLLDHPHPK